LLVVFDGNHTLAPRCREREPSTPSAYRVMNSGRQDEAALLRNITGKKMPTLAACGSGEGR
jgi:hypothetical protein